MLSDFTTEIPDSAFEGCTSLKDVYVPNLTSIGNRAFYGCTSLSTLTIPTDVVSLGNNAFNGVNEVVITAANKNVALAAVNSGVKNLVLNISAINDKMKDAVLEAPSGMNAFELRGERKEYENLRIKSNAGKTTVNGVNFINCTQVPMELHSSAVDLNQTSVSATGYCMILAANSCSMNLFGTNQMNSSNGNAIVCGNLALANANSGVQASLQVSGNIYICGSITNQSQYLSQTNGHVINITQEEFNQYISGVYRLVYDANGGAVQETDKVAYSGVAIGALPSPTRTGYTFAGWYTAPSDGTPVTSSSTFISNSTVTIFAHWTAITCTVSYNGNGGTASTASKNVGYDSAYGSLATASRTGYSFAGWFTSASGGSKVESSTIVTATSNHTLYAHWTANNYTVTYDGNGGSVGTSNKSVVYDSTYGSLTTANRTGYSFAGWYTSASGGTKIESSTKVTTASNHTLYAHWKVNSYSYNIVYRSSNGVSLGTSSATYNFGTTNTITPPGKQGYNTDSGVKSSVYISTTKLLNMVEWGCKKDSR